MEAKFEKRILFNRTGKLGADGRALVQILIYHVGVGERRYLSTKERLPPNEWNKKQNRARDPDVQSRIEAMIASLVEYERTCKKRGQAIRSLRDFDGYLLHDRTDVIDEPTNFTDFFQQQVERERIKIQTDTYRRRMRVLERLKAYRNNRSIAFEELTFSFIEGYDYYLRSKKKLGTSTAGKDHSILSGVIKKAIKRGLMNHRDDPYYEFKPEKESSQVVILLQEEIERIEKLAFQPDQEHLQQYRDAFLFGCYTALRISDVTRIQQHNLIATEKGLVLEMNALKTGKLMRLPLYAMFQQSNQLSKPELLMDRYKRDDNRPLFARSHQKINKYLKVIIRLAGIRKKVTFHTARHSALTYLAGEMSTFAVQQIAQHSSIRTTQKYVHMSGKSVENELNRVRWAEEKTLKPVQNIKTSDDKS